MAQRTRFRFLCVLVIVCSAGILQLYPANCRAAISWNFEDALQTGLPAGWSVAGRYGTWAAAPSQLNVGSGKVLAATFSPPATRMLIFNENAGPSNALTPVITELPSYLSQNLTEVSTPSDFANQLANGGYDLAIFAQSNGFPVNDYYAAYSALSQYLSAGGRAIADDIFAANPDVAAFGTSVTLGATGSSSMTVTNSTLASDLTNPVATSTQFNRTLTPTTGVSAATLNGANGSAIVIGNSGRSIFNAFSSYYFANLNQGSQLYKNEIAYEIMGLLNSGAGSTATIGPGIGASEYPNQPQIEVDTYSPPFQIPDPATSTVSFDFNYNVGAGTFQDSADFTLVTELNGDLVEAANLWNYGLDQSPPENVEVCLGNGPGCVGVNPSTTYRLRIRVRDGDLSLDSLHRVEVDNVLISGGAFLVGLAGDYNGDNAVNTADYVLWRKSLGGSGTALLNRDPNNSGSVNLTDYTFWKSHYGNSGGGSGLTEAGAVPESVSLVLVALLGIWATFRQNRRQIHR